MDEKTMSVSEMRARLIEKAATDEAFRARLLAEPRAVIQSETGVSLPAGFHVEVHEDTADTAHLILPPVADAQLDDADLEQVAGGGLWPSGSSSSSSGRTYGYARGAGGKCFRPDALVRLADGRELPAGEVRPGDELFSPGGVARVARAVGFHEDPREEPWVSVNGRAPFFTGSHPVVTRRGEVPGASLRPGDVVTLAGEVAEVVRTVELVPIAQASVNIETEGSAPYFVNGVLFGSVPTLAAALRGGGSADARAA